MVMVKSRNYPYGDGQSGYFIFDGDGYMLSGLEEMDKDNGKDSGTDLYYLGTQDRRMGTHQLPVVGN